MTETTIRSENNAISRRRFLGTGSAAIAGVSLGGGLLPLLGCTDGSGNPPAHPTAPSSPPASMGSVREFSLVAESVEVEMASGRTWKTWGYNGGYPGPEIRVTEGERLRITVENRLPNAGTTVHWHGVPVPNPMDGVAGLTQEPIPAGEAMVYEFDAAPAGTYMYHSHARLQLDRGLVGPLIIEERTPHVEYDREYVVILDDYLPDPPQTLTELATAQGDEQGGMMGGMMERMMDRDNGGMMEGMMGQDSGGMGSMMDQDSGMMGGMMGGIVPPYEGLMINGRLPEDPADFNVRRGERVRLRFINLSSATTYRLAIAGHTMKVSHSDGRPVEPIEVDSLFMGMGERYDVIVEAENPGVWPLVATTVEGENAPARAVLRYQDAAGSALHEGLPEGLATGRILRYSDLQSVETLPTATDDGPDRTFDLQLSGGMPMMGQSADEWTINGQRYPGADPLEVHEGERLRVNIMNMSMMFHPMHLHGHFFRLGNVLKDTVLVQPHMGRATFDFVADNPGDWFFHCHNLYHVDSGMARVFSYT